MRTQISPESAEVVPPLRFEVFGGPKISGPMEPGGVQLSSLQGSLLTLLAAYGRKGASRPRLVNLLWEDGDESTLRHRLGQTLHELRRKLGSRDLTIYENERYRLNPEVIATDLERLNRLLAEKRLKEAATLETQGVLPNLDRAPTEAFHEWATEREARWRGEVRTAAAVMWDESSQTADFEGAREAAYALHGLAPEDEKTAIRLSRILASADRADEALSVLQGFRERSVARTGAWSPSSEFRNTLEALPSLARERRQVDPYGGRGRPRSSPFVGRNAEVRALRVLLRNPPPNRAQLVSLIGPLGIGKSRLAGHVLSAAPLDGDRVVSCRCGRFEANIPLAPLIEGLSGDWVARRATHLPQPWWSICQSLVPEWGAAGPPPPPIDPSAVPRRTCEALLRLLECLAANDPLILFVDDLHWVDETTLTVLEYIRDRWRRGSLTLLTTIDPNEVGRTAIPKAYWGEDLASAATVMQVPGLPEDHSREFVRYLCGEGIPDSAVERYVRWSHGNPYHLTELCRSKVALRGPVTQGSPALPPVLARELRLRLLSLPSGTRDVLSTIACALGPVAPAEIRRACDQSADEVTEALRILGDLGWIDWQRRGVSIRQELVGRVVEQELSDGRRQFILRKLSESLDTHSDTEHPPEAMGALLRRAYYELLSGRVDRACELGLKAVVLTGATGQYSECANLLGRLAAVSRRDAAELLMALGHLEAAMDHADAANLSFSKAASGFHARAMHEEATQARLAALRAELGSSSQPRFERREEVAQLRIRAERNGWLDITADALDLEVRMADRSFDRATILSLLTRAETLAGSCQEPNSARVQLLLTQSLAVFHSGDPEPLMNAAREARALAESLEDIPLQLRCTNMLVLILIQCGELETGQGECTSRALLSLAERSGDLMYSAFARMNWGVWHIDTWRNEEAILLLGGCLEDMGHHGPREVRAAVHLNLAVAHHRLRSRDDAQHHLQRAISNGALAGTASAQVTARALQGLLDLDGGRLASAAELAKDLEGKLFPPFFDPTPAAELISRVKRRVERDASALSFLERVLDELPHGMVLHRAFILRIQGDLLAHCRHSSEARRAWSEGHRLVTQLSSVRL